METNPIVYKSLTPKDRDFQSYLMGDFDARKRALPVSSMNLQTVNEVVTFEIRDLDQLEPSSYFVKVRALLKPETWLTVLVPLGVVYNLEPQSHLGSVILLGLILLMVLTFANWKSDLADHLEGWDRLQGSSSSNVLRKGWFTGVQIQRWGWIILGGAVTLGIPLLLEHPWVLFPFFVSALALLVLLPQWWRKSIIPGFSSILIFLLTGPLLTMGIDLTFDGQLGSDSFLIGAMWGLWMSFVRQQKIYTKQWYLYQRRSNSFFIGLGFDRSKSLMRLLIPVIPIALVIFSLFLRGGAAWFFPLLVTELVFVSMELQANEKIQSCIGSHLNHLQTLFRWHHYATALVFLLGSILWPTVL